MSNPAETSAAPTVSPYGTVLEPAPRFNRQEYLNSVLCGSPEEQHWLENPDKLHGALLPNLAVLHEQPMHRAVIMLKAAGLSNNEIAARTGYTYPWVSQVLRQPWARQRLIEELNNAGREGIQNLLQSTVVDSILTLVELRENGKESVRAIAAKELLNRALGMPTQHVEQTLTTGVTPKELEKLDQELAVLTAEEKRLTGN